MGQVDQIRGLLDQGFSDEAIVRQLGVTKGQITAVRAHMTMGTYDRAASVRSGGIYLRRQGELIALTERPYETEDVLQALLADHPGLLAGDDVGDTPRRWVLLSREVGVADDDGASGRWSLDHLFVDQDAIPTLVEVKRSSDTRIRREVVGQLLEYAANGTRYWPVEKLRLLYDASCQTRDADPDDELRAVLGEDTDLDGWWTQLEENLRLGRLRLVFVADVISRELRRIIEFLNEQMTQTEVLGVEIRQYVDSAGEHQTLVPRLIGQTEAARGTKVRAPGSRIKRTWDRESWFEVFGREKPDQVAIVQRLVDWSEATGLVISFGRGEWSASMKFGYVDATTRVFPFFIYSTGGIEIEFQTLHTANPPFDQLEQRRALRDRLTAIDGVDIPDERLEKRPGFSVSAIASDKAFAQFTEAIEWTIEQVKRAAGPG
jgi:hypothetical protein